MYLKYWFRIRSGIKASKLVLFRNGTVPVLRDTAVSVGGDYSDS
jgi:hypothetical protein